MITFAQFIIENDSPKEGGGPGTSNVYKDGKYVMWHRSHKDAKFHASQIGGNAVKNAATPKAAGTTNHVIKMPDGSFKPMTRANIKAAQHG